MDGPREYLLCEVSQREILHDITYTESKNNTNESICKRETDSQT